MIDATSQILVQNLDKRTKVIARLPFMAKPVAAEGLYKMVSLGGHFDSFMASIEP